MIIYFNFVLALVNSIGMRAGRVLFALYALKLGAQPLTIGVLAATFSALPLLLSLQVGRLSDRFGSRWLMVAGALGGAAGLFVPFVVHSLAAIFIAAATSGIAVMIFNVSLQNQVGLLSGREQRAKNFSYFSLVMASGAFVGPLFIGFAIDRLGYGVSCLILVALPLAAAAMLALWGGVFPRGSGPSKPRGPLRDTLQDPMIWGVLAASSMLRAGIDLFQFYVPVYGHAVGLSAEAIGVVIAAYSAAAFFIRLLTPRVLGRFSERTVLTHCFLVGAAGFLLVPFFKSAVVLSALAFVFGLGMGCGQPLTMMMTFERSSVGRSGEALGLRMTVNHLTRVVGPVLFGWIGSAFGLPPIFWLNGLMLGCGAALTRWYLAAHARGQAQQVPLEANERG